MLEIFESSFSLLSEYADSKFKAIADAIPN